MAFDRRKSWLAPAQAGARFTAPARRSAFAFAGVGGGRALALAAVVVAGGLALSACGRNGPPGLPPGPAIPAVPSASNAPAAAPPIAAASSEVPAAAGVALEKLPLTTMQEVEPRITKAALGVLSVESSVKSRAVYGGTAPKNVRAQAKRWLKRLQDDA